MLRYTYKYSCIIKNSNMKGMKFNIIYKVWHFISIYDESKTEFRKKRILIKKKRKNYAFSKCENIKASAWHVSDSGHKAVSGICRT